MEECADAAGGRGIVTTKVLACYMELWIGHIRLKVEFPQLFSFTRKTNASIA